MRHGKTMALAGLTAAALGGCAAPGMPQRMELTSTLTGYQAVPGPGDLDGTGTARVRVDADSGQVCWELNARGIDPASAAHIHRGEAGSGGPPVVPLTTPSPERSEGCASVAVELARELIARPHGFHVNVHNSAHPGGAIRGQLRGQAIRGQALPRPPSGR